MRVQCLLAKGGHFSQQTKRGRVQWEITTCNRYARELNRAHPYKIIIIHVENLHQPCQLFENAVLGENTQKKNDGKCLQMNTCDQRSSGGRLSKTGSRCQGSFRE